MWRVTLIGAAAAATAMVATAMYAMGDEIRRYIRITRMDDNPGLVGASITPQGNEAALGMTEEQRERKRIEPGMTRWRPIDRRMPKTPPADQAH